MFARMIARPEEPEIRWIELDEAPVPVLSPHGIIYSTKPQHALGPDKAAYVLKGPALEVAFAEAAAHRLAAAAQLSVTPWALARSPAGTFFAGQEMRWRSDVDGLIRDIKSVVNPELLAEVVAFDAWIANTDRNVGNIVAEPVPRPGNLAAIRLYAIDFERSGVLRGKGQVELATLENRHCWPHEELAPFCRKQPRPRAICARITSLTDGQLHASLAPLLLQLPTPATFDLDRAVHALLARGKKLESYIEGVWDGTDH